jgi:hypothetical protein
MDTGRIVDESAARTSVPMKAVEWLRVRTPALADETRATGRRAFLGRLAAVLVPLALVFVGRPRLLVGGESMGCGYCCYFPCYGTEIQAFCNGECGGSLEDCCIQCETGCCPDGCSLWCEPGCPER